MNTPRETRILDVQKLAAWSRFVDAWCDAEELRASEPTVCDQVLDEADRRIRDAVAMCEEFGVDCTRIVAAMESGGAGR